MRTFIKKNKAFGLFATFFVASLFVLILIINMWIKRAIEKEDSARQIVHNQSARQSVDKNEIEKKQINDTISYSSSKINMDNKMEEIKEEQEFGDEEIIYEPSIKSDFLIQ